MTKRCPACKRLFRTYVTTQRFCCYDCHEDYKGTRGMTIEDVVSLGNEKHRGYGDLVAYLERGDKACITRG